ncbi:hypothetical protein ACU4GI_20400 [Cupriavidus basilensis]
MTDEEYKQALAEMAMINTIFHPRPDLYPPAIYPNNDLLIELLILKRKGLVQITNLGFEEEVLPERRPANDVEERAWIASRMRPGNASMKDQMWAAFRILQRRLPGAKLEVAEHALPRGFTSLRQRCLLASATVTSRLPYNLSLNTSCASWVWWPMTGASMSRGTNANRASRHIASAHWSFRHERSKRFSGISRRRLPH